MECPRTYLGNDFVQAVNLAGMCGDGILPVSGGLLEQSAWFIDLWQTLKSEQSAIETEQIEKAGRGK